MKLSEHNALRSERIAFAEERHLSEVRVLLARVESSDIAPHDAKNRDAARALLRAEVTPAAPGQFKLAGKMVCLEAVECDECSTQLVSTAGYMNLDGSRWVDCPGCGKRGLLRP